MTVGIFLLKLFLWIAITYGITQIIVSSSIFKGIRNWVIKSSYRMGSLVTCMLCTGVWISFLISFLLWSPSKTLFMYDVVDVERMVDLELRMEYQNYTGSDTLQDLMVTVVYFFKKTFFNIIFIFVDGMMGGTFIWFLYVFERRLAPKE